jgi:curved DNA-binding protein CbpA
MTHYDTLRIRRDEPAEGIKSAYRKLCSELHPDRNPEKDTTAEMQSINVAHSVLRDPAARAAYDSKMGFASAPSALDAAWADFWARMADLEAKIAASKATSDRRADEREFVRRTQQEPPKPPSTPDVPKPKPKRAKVAKAPKATPEPTPKQRKQERAMRAELAAEVNRLRNVVPPFILNGAGTQRVKKWKDDIRKWQRYAVTEHTPVDVLRHMRESLLQAAVP